jgi:hypothetical protein
MYNALKSKFKTTDIYCPTPVELQNKLVIMAQGDYTWKSTGTELMMTIDLSKVLLKSVLNYTGGMGIRLNNTRFTVQQVFIDGQEHFAYNEDMLILPNLTKPSAEIKVILGETPSTGPHLLYVSKRMPEIKKNGNDLTVTLMTKSKARFGFYAPSGFIVMNADWFEWNRKGNSRLDGYVTSDRTITLKQLKTPGIAFHYSDLIISNVKETESEIILTLPQEKAIQEKLIRISSVNDIQSIQLNDKLLEAEKDGDIYNIKLNLVIGENNLHIQY